MSEVILPQQPLECRADQALIIQKGSLAKTKGLLIGCFVPIALYDDEIVLGHFGPRKTNDAIHRLSPLAKLARPQKILLYRDGLKENSYWLTRKQEYLSLYEDMRRTIADLFGMRGDQIKEYKYPTGSNIHIDWTSGEKPIITPVIP